MDFWIRAAQLILSLSILIVVHEFGHFIPARIFKIRVEKFYLFFDPWFSLFKKKVGDTEWGIGWLPLGGYVKIAGMVDESMDKEQMALPPKEDEFRSKPAWQRLIVMLGGVTVNVIVGFFIYILVIFGYGKDVVTNDNLPYGVAVHPEIKKLNLGFEDGDKLIAIDGEPIENIREVRIQLWLRGKRSIEVEHANGEKETIVFPETIGEGENAEDFDRWLFTTDAINSFSPRTLPIVDSNLLEIPSNDSKNSLGRLLTGDQILAINGENTPYYHDLTYVLRNYADTVVPVSILRENDTVVEGLRIYKDHTLGFQLTSQFDYTHLDYSFGEAISAGFEKGWNTMGDYAGQLKYLFTKKGASSMGGFGAIGKMFPTTWDWQAFWLNTAFISLVLAIMNILPIPALDGGHVVFLIYEIITGKEAPQKVLEYAQLVGFVLLLSLLLYANGNDVVKAIFGN
ncbi:MAG: RIP metalloprotease RseP [Lishizhenia sp.]